MPDTRNLVNIKLKRLTSVAKLKQCFQCQQTDGSGTIDNKYIDAMGECSLSYVENTIFLAGKFFPYVFGKRFGKPGTG